MEKKVLVGELLIALLAVLLLARCAGMRHTDRQAVPGDYNVSVAESVKTAAQAMQRLGFWITKQNEAAGYLYGEKVETRWGAKGTYYLQVHIGRSPGGPIEVSATSIAGSDIAYTDELPGIVNDFYTAFNDILTAKYMDLPREKPVVKFEEHANPRASSLAAPEKKQVAQPRQSPASAGEPSTVEYEL
ncbi:MAG: hypothetical protein JRJ12_12460 [Deltaproteobacteria bacterium]|nr:hypothetical protein [Deltaproteobacteria bacterium]MBW2072466.1 hypothetical protein [Deltaproteobacteria bacterium]